MKQEIELNIDSTVMGKSACMRNFKLTTVGEVTEDGMPDGIGGYKSIPSAPLIYGVAVHKFVDTMFKTGGHYPTAKMEADKSFHVHKLPPGEKKLHLGDALHLKTTCYNLWTMYIEEEKNFEILEIPVTCYWCNGTGGVTAGKDLMDGIIACKHCSGKGVVNGPATELTFRIPFYEDGTIKVFLCGTIDKVGQFRGGCFAIGDWKTTSSWKQKDYLTSYELSRQLRIYTLACKLEAQNNPTSVLGRIGATRMGSFIDAIFIKPKANDNEYGRTDVYQYSAEDINSTQLMLTDFCTKLSHSFQHNYWPQEGIINGSCTGLYGRCEFWACCKSNDQVAKILLKRDFTRKHFDPLAYNEH